MNDMKMVMKLYSVPARYEFGAFLPSGLAFSSAGKDSRVFELQISGRFVQVAYRRPCHSPHHIIGNHSVRLGNKFTFFE